jgi:hypothetical protein
MYSVAALLVVSGGVVLGVVEVSSGPQPEIKRPREKNTANAANSVTLRSLFIDFEFILSLFFYE